jgi:hypothetical protein
MYFMQVEIEVILKTKIIHIVKIILVVYFREIYMC